ncbi:phosphomannomutase [Enterobacter pasteurii]|uniref:phosphomannomutase n=1 Tax=Enterobacter pasteurii TaxID=3029761 RepID=UPI0011DD4D0C|nr:phosphomannomutase [Enterobacter pasteurii]QLA70471.1 phosphomannomutase [Enterobacter pasteurii]
MLSCKKIIANSNIVFGTSGARGLVTDFNHNVCSAFVHAFLSDLRNNYYFNTVALAIDNRPSSYEIAQSCADAIVKQGFNVEFHGVIPTPALAYYSMQKKIPCVMVTGSHIPFDRNGLKFYRPDGEISKADEQAIINSDYHFSSCVNLPELFAIPDAANAYIARYADLFNKNALKGKKIGIYEHSSAGRDLYSKLFNILGAEVVSLGRSNDFIPIDTEAVGDEDRVLALKWSEEHQLDAIFSTDGDGDRPLVADEKGTWLRGDILGLLTSIQLNINALSIPVSCNTAVELTHRFKNVERTKIGSPYVISAFEALTKKYDNVAGFEANGGYLLATDMIINGQVLSKLPTRDALLPALMLLIASGNGNISSLVENLPQRFTWSDRVKNFDSEKSKQILVSAVASPEKFLNQLGLAPRYCTNIDQTDGVRFILDNGDIVHLRPSGNAPELRCYTEAADEGQAKVYVETILDQITKFL